MSVTFRNLREILACPGLFGLGLLAVPSVAEAHQLPSVMPAGPGVSAVVRFCIVPVLPVCWVALSDSRQGNEFLWQAAGLH